MLIAISGAGQGQLSPSADYRVSGYLFFKRNSVSAASDSLPLPQQHFQLTIDRRSSGQLTRSQSLLTTDGVAWEGS